MEEKLQAARNVADSLQTQFKTALDELFFGTLDGVVFDEQGEVRPEIRSQQDVQSNLSREFPRLVPLVILGSGVHQSATSALKCCGEGDIDSGYILARAMVERAINYAYLNVCDDVEFQGWQDYSVQKAFRLLNRQKTVGDVTAEINLLPTPNLSEIPELEALIRQFTGKSGKEITRWTKLTLDERLEYIEGNVDAPKGVVPLLITGLLSVYETGAEAQHGTLFGVGLRAGLFLPLEINEGVHKSALLTSIIECLSASILVLAHIAKRPDWAEAATVALVSFVNETNKGTGKPQMTYTRPKRENQQDAI